jgi:hypothetical protein
MQKNWKFKIGIALIVLSTMFFISIIAVPFLNVDSKTKITISTILVVLGEVTFWIGGILLGKELFNKYKSYLNPKNWRKKKPATVTADTTGNDSSEQ